MFPAPLTYNDVTKYSHTSQQSDHFVQFLGWFEDANSIHIAMEYIPHGDLYQYITQYPGDAKTDVKVIARQILTGLVVLHGREICHRDLKPQVDSDLILYAHGESS